MAKRKAKPDMETASRDELVAYISRLEASRDQMQANNKAVSKYADRVNNAVRSLAVDCSLVFQAMAEKANVRAHPSTTKVVEYFDAFAGLQWGTDEPPSIQWPTDWDFDGEDAWTGDADMQLNAPIAELVELVDAVCFQRGTSDAMRTALREAVERVQKAMLTHIGGIKANHGFRVKEIDISNEPEGMGWAVLDLAQDMRFANEMLRRDLRAAVYRRVCSDLYRLAFSNHEPGPSNFDVKVLGGSSSPF